MSAAAAPTITIIRRKSAFVVDKKRAAEAAPLSIQTIISWNGIPWSVGHWSKLDYNSVDRIPVRKEINLHFPDQFSQGRFHLVHRYDI